MARQKNATLAEILWGKMSQVALDALEDLARRYSLSIASGDLLYLGGKWYITHSGLLGIARRKHCAGIIVQPIPAFCDASAQRWAFAATVYKSKTCRGFVGHGDPKVRDRLCQLIRQHQLDANLVKSYATDFCGTKELREATREQVEQFVTH